nr:hypothetical protein [Tanacetum cinerariifolium]
LPEDHMADFHHLDDAREIWLAVKARFDVARTLKTRDGLEYLSFDDLYNKLRSLEIDVKGGSSYGLRGTTVALTHSAFIGAASTNTKMVYSPSHSSSITYTSAHSGSIMEDVLHSFVAKNEPTQQLAYEDFKQVDQMEMKELDIKWQMAMLSLRRNRECNLKNVGEKARYSAFKISGVKTKEPKAMVNKTADGEQVYGLMVGFKSDFADNALMLLVVPKTNDSFSTVDVKILPKSDVKDPSPTNGFSSCSFKENVKSPRNLCNKSGIADRIHCKNNFVCTKTCFVCGSKSHLIKDCDVYDNVDNFPSVVSKAASVPAGSRNSSASISASRSIPVASRNRPASIHADRHIPAGRFNKPAPFPAGRSVLTELASPEQTATSKDVSNLFMAMMVYQKPLGYFSSPMIHVLRTGLVIHPPG